ncbi:MAG: hypothetical protein QOG65_2207 [Actinomycetota bacterium]|jgi:hypothetical protein|nr:hypothetical protein [Actinomycetota bacterium]
MNADVPDVIDVGLRFLDRQIIDCNDREVAKVDDLEAAFDGEGRPYVIAIMCGPGAWAPRLGGRPGRWILAIWRRLHPAVEPEPARIPMNVVAKIDSAVRLSVPRTSTAAATLDRWVDHHVIGRIPGAGNEHV